MIVAEPLTAAAFDPFGEVIEAAGEPSALINQGKCGRFHDLCTIDVEGEVGISVFRGTPYGLPLRLEMVERHPLGSQAFIPMQRKPFLVIVAPDEGDVPGEPLAFLTAPGQGVNIRRNTWHGVLTPIHDPALFAVIDRVSPGQNLEEHWFDAPHTFTLPG
ncbi:MAG: ureidoglycolate lyase [Rubricella sp.]